MAMVLDGKALAASLREEMKKEIASYTEASCRPPCLAVILVGEDPASQIYVRNKEKAAEQIGMKSLVLRLDQSCSEEELLSLIDRLNRDEGVDGMIVQLPLPAGFELRKIQDRVRPEKDADGLGAIQAGRMLLGQDALLPCTPAGVIRMLEAYDIPIWGQEACVVGYSSIVGKPMSILLSQKGATVTVCNSKTKDLNKHCREADILVVACGKPELIGAEAIKEGAAVVDVGIHRREDGTICGDVRAEEVSAKAGALSPVPGGVGPMTIAMLLHNCLKAYKENYVKTRDDLVQTGHET